MRGSRPWSAACLLLSMMIERGEGELSGGLRCNTYEGRDGDGLVG